MACVSTFAFNRPRFFRRFPVTVTLMDEAEMEEWIRDFEAAAHRSLEERLQYAFIHSYKPVLDDQPYRSFNSMEEYRRWCEKAVPSWLGYGRTL